MNISKIKLIYTALTGGVAGIIGYVLDLFNDQVLGRITDKDTAKKYLLDVQAASGFATTVLENHRDDISEARREAGFATVHALGDLAKALEDCRIDQDELDSIVEAVKGAVEAWKAAK